MAFYVLMYRKETAHSLRRAARTARTRYANRLNPVNSRDVRNDQLPYFRSPCKQLVAAGRRRYCAAVVAVISDDDLLRDFVISHLRLIASVYVSPS